MGVNVRSERNVNVEKGIRNLETKKVLKVGWPEKIQYPEELGEEYVAVAAATNEYGDPTRKIPPRPFLRPAISQNKNVWANMLRTGAKRVVQGQTTIEDVLLNVGFRATGDISQAIKNVTSPALSLKTIANRLTRFKTPFSKKTKAKIKEDIATSTGIAKPLIDTKLMIRSVSAVLEDE